MDALKCEICDLANDVQQTDVDLACCVECREFFGFQKLQVEYNEPTPEEIAEFRLDTQADEFADYHREQQYGKGL